MNPISAQIKQSPPLHKDDEHLAPLEAAARIYCAHMGQDPDHMNRQEGMIVGVPILRPTWCFAAEKLLDLIQMMDALKKRPAIFEQQTH